MRTPNRGSGVHFNHCSNGRSLTGRSGIHPQAVVPWAILLAMVAFGLTYCGGNQKISGDTPSPDPRGNASELSAAPASVSFGTVGTGSSATQMVTLSNTGQGAVKLSEASVTGSGFSISNLALPMTLPPGASTSFYAQFSPAVAGSSSGSIALISNASNSPLVVSLLASGASAQLAASPASVGFGEVNTGSSTTEAIVLTNRGGAPITVTQASVSGAGFSVSGLALPSTLAAGQSESFTATFAPTSASSYAGSISVVSTASDSPLAVGLSGSGTAVAGKLTVNPASLSFGNVAVGNSSILPVVVTNSGSASVTITQASTTGSGFSVSGASMPIALSAGQNTSFSITFDPTTAGGVSGNLSITSNASNSPAVTNLSATGTIQHSVSLSWVASASAAVTGYNVYRGTVSGGPYSKLTSSPVSGMSYTDSTVEAGQTYYYVTTSVNSQGAESSDSNQATAVIPSP